MAQHNNNFMGNPVSNTISYKLDGMIHRFRAVIRVKNGWWDLDGLAWIEILWNNWWLLVTPISFTHQTMYDRVEVLVVWMNMKPKQYDSKMTSTINIAIQFLVVKKDNNYITIDSIIWILIKKEAKM